MEIPECANDILIAKGLGFENQELKQRLWGDL
jgi:hypothetical protein